MVVSPLAQNIETNNKETIGFIEAGKTLAIKLDLSVDSVEKIDVMLNKKSITTNTLIEARSKMVLGINIPEEIQTTLYGEASLREEYNNYFEVNKENIGSRKIEPYILTIKLIYNNREYIEEVKIDVLDTFLSNINSQAHVTNSAEVNSKISLMVWLDL